MNQINHYPKIGLFIEVQDGKPLASSLELISIAQQLKEKLAGRIEAFVIGENTDEVAHTLISYGTDKVWKFEATAIAAYMEDVLAEIVAKAIELTKPELLLGSATNLGRSLFPRIAVKLRTGLTADCTELDIDSQKNLVQVRPAMSGSTMARIITPAHRPQMATIRPGVYPQPDKIAGHGGEIALLPALSRRESKIELLYEMKHSEAHLVNFNTDIVVAAGRGIQEARNLQLVRQFASLLGGSFGVTRALVDASWVDYQYQIGLTGKTVSPKVYIACGISGAIQHRVGIQNSATIIAINKDPKAMIFNFADYGIVGDLCEVLLAISNRIKAGLSNNKTRWFRDVSDIVKRAGIGNNKINGCR
jgi:electron transfer flavoprotein alpha subunit